MIATLRPLAAGLAFAALCAAPLHAARAVSDAPGTKDHPAFTRMPAHHIDRMEVKEFDKHTFVDLKGERFDVEGRLTELLYTLDPGATEPSRVQVLRNFENAALKAGGAVVGRTDDGDLYLKLGKGGREIWAHINAYIPAQYQLWIVEKEAMQQAVTATAAQLADGLKTTGHVALYGIYFDTGKAELKPESEAALAQVAALLQANPALKLHVVGHTDDAGDFEKNLKLSQARAQAVVAALAAKHKIAAPRLRSAGVASLAPVESNESEQGRAKNRRVELVRQ